MNYDRLYELRIRQFAWKGYSPYCDWFTYDELKEFFEKRKTGEDNEKVVETTLVQT
jgi:hypothetical protein